MKFENISPHFKMHEFLCPVHFREHNSYILDIRIVQLANEARAILKAPIYCNNYAWGGKNFASGSRTQELNKITNGAKHSQHLHGRALDLKSKQPIGDLRKSILEAASRLKLRIRLLNYNTWIHVDFGYIL